MAQYNYVSQFDNRIREMYGHELISNDLYNTNPDIQIRNTKDIRLPKMTVSGYKDHDRTALGFNTGTITNDFETKTLDHDRDIEFFIDPMDVDETNLIVSMANVQKRFETSQAIPELDCYTFSKLYSEAKRVGATIKNTKITAANVLTDFDENCEAFEDAGVPLSRCVLYCTAAFHTALKNAEGIQRTFSVNGDTSAVNRAVHSLDDLGKIKVVALDRFKTAYDFTEGYTTATSGKQIHYILIDPEAQVSRVKYAYINTFTPGHDSRTADNYLYQNRRYNGTFALMDDFLKKGCIICAEAEGQEEIEDAEGN